MLSSPYPTVNGCLPGILLDTVQGSVLAIDPDGIVMYLNRAGQRLLGLSAESVVNRPYTEVLAHAHDLLEVVETTRQNKVGVIGQFGKLSRGKGEPIPIIAMASVLMDESGNSAGIIAYFRDIFSFTNLSVKNNETMQVGEITSLSPLMSGVLGLLPAMAASLSTILLEGETGTGKEWMARILHALSPRGSGPFVAVNCAALPETLMESELFGYKKGAFTGASRDKPGRFALANGGTLFLDEVAELSPALQAKMLRVLQDKMYEPLGATKPEAADVRVMAATNRVLTEQVRMGQFRSDLYYRLNVMNIEIPPLRHRREDISMLADQFVRRLNRAHGKSIVGIAPTAMAALLSYDWPGNIRELENAVERAFFLCGEGIINIEHFPAGLRRSDPESVEKPQNLSSAKDLFLVQAIRAALVRCNYNRAAAARDLGIHPTTLFRRMKKLGIPHHP